MKDFRNIAIGAGGDGYRVSTFMLLAVILLVAALIYRAGANQRQQYCW